MDGSPGKTFVALLLVASSATAGEVDRTFEKRFDVEPGARLEIEHGDGEVVVAAWEEAAIEVVVRYRVEFKRVGVGRDPDLEVRFDQSGEVVRVVGDEGSVGGVGFFIDERHRRASGTLGAGAGRIRASTGNGSITLRQKP